MAETRCFCGATFSADDDAALVPVMRSHFDEVHGFDPGDAATLNAIERIRQLGPVPERRLEIGPVTVEPLTPDRAADYLAFFDFDAFTDNPGWASCYCLFHHVIGVEPPWEARRWSETRSEVARRISEGRQRGFLAYEGGRVVGWCNINQRREFPEHASGEASDDGTASVVCFMVAPAYRGFGVARSLLESALEWLPRHGYLRIEGYPVESPTSSAAAYKGTTAFYESLGFARIADGVMSRQL
jgi:GNAT superfamily N-acetyltransferase